ncbi:right-handed parallel beta-helix repeat-containing protein [Megalodesulfovibrio gigas]|nr:right-handed parallel beta-helix repeat-containing protein [Megalodesulfovibrio gigas]
MFTRAMFSVFSVFPMSPMSPMFPMVSMFICLMCTAVCVLAGPACLHAATFSPGVQADVCNRATLSGVVRYVATTGNDTTGDGTAARPYRTLLRAAEVVQANETIVLRQGTYVEADEIRLRVPGVTIRSYPGEWAIVDRRAETEYGSGIYFYVGSDGGALECVEVRGGFYAVSTETKWDWGDPDDRAGASRIRIENTKLHSSLRDVVKIKPNSDDIIIRHNEIYNSGVNEPPDDCNAEGIDNVNGDRTLVAHNHIHDICSTGVYLKGGATDGVIEYNLIERTGGAGILLGFDTSPEYFDLTVNPNYYENIRGIARNNLVRDTGGSGIGFYASLDAKAYNNTLVDTASSFHTPIYFGITFQDWDPEAGRPANRNPTVLYNIVSQPGTPTQQVVAIRYSTELGGLSALDGALRINANCYWRAAGAAWFDDGRTNWSGNFAQWKTHIGGDGSTRETNPQLDADSLPQQAVCMGRGHGGALGGGVPGMALLLE